ncbi:MAG: hypothetical protein CK431_10280 [Mycobacterium sp.]|nr:MAG: hypothetical protein CK431_10280 [Mycobacterium sp.]
MFTDTARRIMWCLTAVLLVIHHCHITTESPTQHPTDHNRKVVDAMSFGAYAQLKNPALLSALVGPEPEKVMPAAQLARTVNIGQPYVSHLINGRRQRVSTPIAKQIASTLGVRMGNLFEPAPSTTRQQSDKTGRVV